MFIYSLHLFNNQFGPNTGVSSMNKVVLFSSVLPLGALPSNLKDEPLNAKIHVWCFF